jgi:hypothetical protein
MRTKNKNFYSARTLISGMWYEGTFSFQMLDAILLVHIVGRINDLLMLVVHND